jgi:ketosteroid isomerase-like protein
VHGRRAIEDYFRRLFVDKRFHFVFTSSSITIHTDLAIERIEYTAEVRTAGSSAPATDTGKGVHLYRRDDANRWKLVLDIWNSDQARLT